VVEFTKLNVDEIVYIVDFLPVSILELKIIEIGYNDDYKRRIKVFNDDLYFELDFDDLKERIFKNKDEAYSVAIKYIFDETNKYIRKITDNLFDDYFELDKALEIYKQIYPEIFI